jgi:hypothetical protein
MAWSERTHISSGTKKQKNKHFKPITNKRSKEYYNNCKKIDFSRSFYGLFYRFFFGIIFYITLCIIAKLIK